jgi:hypothetical protein
MRASLDAVGFHKRELMFSLESEETVLPDYTRQRPEAGMSRRSRVKSLKPKNGRGKCMSKARRLKKACLTLKE